MWVDCFCVGDFVGHTTNKKRERETKTKNTFGKLIQAKQNTTFFPWLHAFLCLPQILLIILCSLLFCCCFCFFFVVFVSLFVVLFLFDLFW